MVVVFRSLYVLLIADEVFLPPGTFDLVLSSAEAAAATVVVAMASSSSLRASASAKQEMEKRS